MAHGHLHIMDIDGKKYPIFNLQYLNMNEVIAIKNALDKVMPKDRNDAYSNVSKSINDMIMNYQKSTTPLINKDQSDKPPVK